MSMENSRPRLFIFLTSVCRLIKNGETETCSCIESQLSTGLATYLYTKYSDVFEKFCFNTAFLAEIDNYYRNKVDPVNGEADEKYDCEEDDGLWLVIELVLNEAL